MYRLYEILPGAFAWTTLIGMVFLSWKLPVAISIFIILFDVYWLLKTVYLSVHLRSTFREMRKNMGIDWIAELGKLPLVNGKSWRDICHIVVLPMYKEPEKLVRESFLSIVKAHYPLEKFIMVLATEEAGGEEARKTARMIEREFGGAFRHFFVTTHPAGLPGEIPGKGANETWAMKKVMAEIIDKENIPHDRVLVSVFDVDTQAPPGYFGRVTHAYLTSEKPLRAIYQPIPLFTNNIYECPALARVVAFSATFWQMMQQARPERLTTFSSQTVPLPALLDIGYWQTNVVSEDSRIFWQCYLRYHGDFRVVPLMYPLTMDANVAPTFWGTMKNLYMQQRRWGWGAENIPYVLNGFQKDRTISRGEKMRWAFRMFEGFHSWATNSLMIFALGWLPVFLGGDRFNASLLSYSLPNITRFIITLSMIGVASSAVLTIALLRPSPSWFRFRHYVFYVLQWMLIPATLIIFGAFPGLEAQTRLMLGGRWRLGFWVTPKGRRNLETEGGVGRNA